MLKDRDYDVTPHIILILSLTLTQNARGVGEGVGGGYGRRRVRDGRRRVGGGGNVGCSVELIRSSNFVTTFTRKTSSIGGASVA